MNASSPSKSPSQPASEAKDAAIRNALRQIRLLIVDDDSHVTGLLRDVLRSLGFSHMDIVGDGAAAIKKMQLHYYDLIICDWKMKPMDGLTFTRYIRTSPDSPNRFISIIMLTGYSDAEHVQVARDAGVTEFLVKPFRIESLCNRIRSVAERPRTFVISGNYTGPDRRRRHVTPPDGVEKRGQSEVDQQKAS